MITISGKISDEMNQVRKAKDMIVNAEDERVQNEYGRLDDLERELMQDLIAERWRIIKVASEAMQTAATRALGAYEEGHLVGSQDLSIMAWHFMRAFDILNDLDDGAWVVR